MNPLLSIWSQPTKTMEYLLEKKSIGYGFIIFLLGSISSGSIAMATTGWFSGLPVFLIVLLSIIITYGGAIIGWVIMSALYTWIGKWLGGTGTFSEMMHVTPAATILSIWLAPMNFLILAIYGSRLFEVPTENFGITNLPLGVYFLMNLVTIGVGIYSIVIMSKGIGLVHKFSALRGFGVIAILMGIGIVIGILFSILIGILLFSLFTTIG
ncbi:YIP1 family protein [Sporosarcina sp. FSL W8-0480]|uniref:YIP1 family protein n=1 Tax=Sporosarcina sp. FSL W8-0480 TaxID=2954701 RepID=UPI0030DA26F7